MKSTPPPLQLERYSPLNVSTGLTRAGDANAGLKACRCGQVLSPHAAAKNLQRERGSKMSDIAIDPR